MPEPVFTAELLRETLLVDGKYENLVVLAILDWEWRARQECGTWA